MGDIKLPDASDTFAISQKRARVTSRVCGKEKPRDGCDGDAGRVGLTKGNRPEDQILRY